MVSTFLETESLSLEAARQFLVLPEAGEVEKAALFKQDMDLLPPLMRTVLNNMMTKQVSGRILERIAAGRDIDNFLELSREMLTLFHGVENMPHVIENMSMRFAQLIDRQPEDASTQRRDIAEKWLGELEHGVKASQLIFTVRNVLSKWGNEAQLSDQDMTELVKWSYEVQNGIYYREGDKQANGYVKFAAELSVRLDKVSDRQGFGDRLIDVEDPMIAPWLYMLLGGDDRPMMAMMYKEVAPKLKQKVSLVVGVSAVDWAENEEGKLRERKPTVMEQFADSMWPDGNYPEAFMGKALTPSQRGIVIGAGQDIKISFDKADRVKDKFINKYLDMVDRVFAEDGVDMHERLGYEVPAVWLSLPMDLVGEVMGADSAWSAYMAEVAHINKQNASLSIPVSVSEARALVNWEVPQGVDKNGVMVKAIVFAHIFRKFGLRENHGFGGLNDLYDTPFWATLAYNLSIPGQKENGHIVTPTVLEQASIKYKTEEELARSLGTLLGQRTSNLALTVMGGNGSAINQRAGSMQSASYAVAESSRLWGLYEQYHGKRTVGLGHSMSGQVEIREESILPVSVRENVDLISLTGVATTNPKEMTFVNKGFNVLLPLLIKMRTHASRGVRQLGNIVSFAGEVVPMKEMLLKRFTHPNAQYELDFLLGRALAAIHHGTLDNSPEYLVGQQDSLYSVGDEHTIEELMETIAIIGGADVSRTLGLKDPVLAARIALKKYRKLGPKKHREVDLTQMSIEEIVRWALGARKENGPGRPTETIVGDFDHYMEATRQGRWVIRMLLMRALEVREYGYRKEPEVRESNWYGFSSGALSTKLRLK